MQGDFNMKRLISLLFSLLFLVMLPTSAFSQLPFKVGALIPFTGRWGDSGRECAKGMLDAGKWLNQRGGISGRKLEIILVDDTSQTSEVMAAYRKLNESDRILLLYIYSVDTALALLPHIHFHRIPTFTSVLPSPFVKSLQYPYIFSITPTPLDLAKITTRFISERSGIKLRKPKILFIGSPDYFGRHFVDEAKEYAKKLGVDIGPDIWIPYPSTAKDISSSLLPLNQYHPDFAYLSFTSKEVVPLMEEVKGMGLETKWICNMKAFDENLSSFDGLLGVQPIAPFGEDVPGMAGIKEAHQRWHPKDSHTLFYVEGWVTIQVIAEALGRSSLGEQGYSRERVKLALEGFNDFVLGGLVPPVTITDKDHRPSVESRIFTITDGKIKRYTDFISVPR